MSVYSDVDIKYNMDKRIVIHPLDESCITPVGYDLRIGFAHNLIDSTLNNSTTKDHFWLTPKASTFIMSMEHVWLSGDLIGSLHPRGTLASKGLIISSTTVDPNWQGQLTFLLFNSSDFPVEVAIGETFITLMLHSTITHTSRNCDANALAVVNNYAQVYDDTVHKRLGAYWSSTERVKHEREFQDRVRAARTPSWDRILKDAIRHAATGGRSFFKNTLLDKATRLLLYVGFVGVPAIGLCWHWLQIHLHVTGSYDGRVFLAQIAAELSIISLLWSSTKK
jgi:dCTP deaminase